MLRLLNQNSSQRHGESGNVPRGVVRAPSTSTDNGRKSKSKSTPDLDAFFRKHKLSQKLKKNLKELGITSLDQLLRMKDKQILMYANLDGFDKSLSSELILLTGALDEHRKQGMCWFNHSVQSQPCPCIIIDLFVLCCFVNVYSQAR